MITGRIIIIISNTTVEINIMNIKIVIILTYKIKGEEIGFSNKINYKIINGMKMTTIITIIVMKLIIVTITITMACIIRITLTVIIVLIIIILIIDMK